MPHGSTINPSKSRKKPNPVLRAQGLRLKRACLIFLRLLP